MTGGPESNTLQFSSVQLVNCAEQSSGSDRSVCIESPSAGEGEAKAEAEGSVSEGDGGALACWGTSINGTRALVLAGVVSLESGDTSTASATQETSFPAVACYLDFILERPFEKDVRCTRNKMHQNSCMSAISLFVNSCFFHYTFTSCTSSKQKLFQRYMYFRKDLFPSECLSDVLEWLMLVIGILVICGITICGVCFCTRCCRRCRNSTRNQEMFVGWRGCSSFSLRYNNRLSIIPKVIAFCISLHFQHPDDSFSTFLIHSSKRWERIFHCHISFNFLILSSAYLCSHFIV